MNSRSARSARSGGSTFRLCTSPTTQAFAEFSQPDFVKVAWAIRVLPRGAQKSHVELEVRVAATDEAAWRKFRRYFRVIGPFSRFIRHSLLRSLARGVAAVPTVSAPRAA